MAVTPKRIGLAAPLQTPGTTTYRTKRVSRSDWAKLVVGSVTADSASGSRSPDSSKPAAFL
jgi:hypothetical protein